MAVTITSARPSPVDADGGARVTLGGNFVPGRPYTVHLGQDDSAPPCYSGTQGLGSLCIAGAAGDLTFALGVVAPGPVALYVRDTTDNTGTAVAAGVVAQAPFLHAMLYALRKNVRPILNTGETEPSQLPDAAPVPGFAQ